MDLMGYSESAFQQIKAEYGAFLAQLGINASAFLSVSAQTGANIAEKAAAAMSWFGGPTLLRAIDELEPPQSAALAQRLAATAPALHLQSNASSRPFVKGGKVVDYPPLKLFPKPSTEPFPALPFRNQTERRDRRV
jgi:hypothetical protein